MRPIKLNSLSLTATVTLLLFCSAALVVAAGPEPTQPLIELSTSHLQPAGETAVQGGEDAPILFAAYPRPVRYLALEIPPLEGQDFTRGYAINNHPQVAGRSFNLDPDSEEAVDKRALLWDFRSGSIALPSLDGESGAWGLNETGTASGFSTNAAGHKHAVSWSLNEGTITDLGTLANPDTQQAGDESTANWGLNNTNTIVGNSDIPNAAGDYMPFHGFVYDAAGGMRDLGTLASSEAYMDGFSAAYDVNEANTVVGVAHFVNEGSWVYRAFTWTEAAGMTALALDAQYTGNDWYATVIGNAGLIGGHVVGAEGPLPHYWTTPADSPVAVVMPAAYPYGEFYGLNQHDQMVGLMFNLVNEVKEKHAFIFDPDNGVLDLNDLIASGSGWVLKTAVDINDMGQIAGMGTLNGNERAFLLTPNADADGDADIDGSDIARLVQELGQTTCGDSCACDYNADDAVNEIDVTLLAMVLGDSH